MNCFERLKKKWRIESNLSVLLILVVFSLAGCSILKVGHAFFALAGVNQNTPAALRALYWALFIFPCYQLLLLLYSIPLGQFRFFWEKEKKLFNWLLRTLRLRSAEN